ncbi:MAG: nucleotide exchange factor GrpE [Candidatus Heimdallarchaeaceae archaeon]
MAEVHEKKNKKIEGQKGETKEVKVVKLDVTNTELESLEKKLEEKTKLADEYLSRLKYLQADFENYKKMEARDRTTFEMSVTEGLIKDLLPIVDAFEIALLSEKKNFNKASFIKGIELIYSDLLSVLGKEGLKQIKAVGKKFDPYYSEVTMTVINNALPEDTVVEEHEKGYMCGSKVIRTSKVTVSKVKNPLDEQ